MDRTPIDRVPRGNANRYTSAPLSCFDYKVVSAHRAAVLVEEDSLASVMTVLSHISPEQAVEMRRQVTFLWRNYFSSMRAITLTTLQIINDRVFPYVARKYEEWNDPPNTVIDITSLKTCVFSKYGKLDWLRLRHYYYTCFL